MSKVKFAIKAIVDNQEAFLQFSGIGRIQFKMRKDQLTFARLRAKGGEVVSLYDATLMDDASAKRALETLVSRPDLFPGVASPVIVDVRA